MTYSPFRFLPFVIKKTRPIHLTFFVTKRCNQRCPFCFYLQGLRTPAKLGSVPPAEMPELTIDEIEKVSASLGSLLWVAFSGGEVFLREDIAELSRIFYKNNRPSILLYPTNGMQAELIKDRMLEVLGECQKSTVVTKLSLDGIGERHDSLRDTPGSFDRVMQSYTLLSGLMPLYPNFELGINTVFCKANEDDMDEIITFVQGLHRIKTHTITLIRGNIKDSTYKDVDIGKYLRAVEKIERNLKDRKSPIYSFKGSRLKAAQDILQRRLIYRTALKKRQLTPCYAGHLNLVLTETGDVYPCESFGIRLGNIRDYDYDLKRLLQAQSAKAAIAVINKNKCWCTHECYFMTNILFNPRTYPALLKEYLQI